MRTLKLSHKQIELIQDSLKQAYRSQIKLIAENKNILSEPAKNEILKSANLFDTLLSDINNGDLDV